MSDDQIAEKLNGKTLHRMFRVTATSREFYEDDIKVGEFKAMLRPNETREGTLVQFYEPHERVGKGFMKGRLRTIDVKDIIDVR